MTSLMLELKCDVIQRGNYCTLLDPLDRNMLRVLRSCSIRNQSPLRYSYIKVEYQYLLSPALVSDLLNMYDACYSQKQF